MAEVVPLPTASETFDDVRGEDRSMRFTYHREHNAVVVSLWLGRVCRATFRLPAAEVPRLIAMLSEVTAPAESSPPAELPTDPPALAC